MSRADITQLLDLGRDWEKFSEGWLQLKKVRRLDGHSKARDMLDAIPRIISDSSSVHIPHLLRGMLNVPENLLISEDEAGAFSIPNQWRVSGTLHRLLEAIPSAGRESALLEAMKYAREISATLSLLRMLRADLPHGIHMEGLTPDTIQGLQRVLAERALEMNLSDLLDFDGQQLLLTTLLEVLNPQQVRDYYRPILDNPQMLLKFLRGSTSRGSMSADGDRVARSVLYVPSTALDKITDRSLAQKAVEGLRSVPDISSEDITLIDAYFAPDFSGDVN